MSVWLLKMHLTACSVRWIGRAGNLYGGKCITKINAKIRIPLISSSITNNALRGVQAELNIDDVYR